jgi:hypothetical protein
VTLLILKNKDGEKKNSSMLTCMMDNSKMVFLMGRQHISGVAGLNMRGNFKEDLEMERDCFVILMGLSITANSLKKNLKACAKS